MAGLTFNDGTGSVTLRGVLAAPFNRFRNFSPTLNMAGVSVSSIGTGRTTLWEYRNDFLVSLELPFISPRGFGGESGTNMAQRLIRHLQRGNTVSLLVEDDVATASVTSWLAPGASATLTLENPRDMLYTFAATFANTTTPYLAVYGGLRP
jgi:hypothetical protein